MKTLILEDHVTRVTQILNKVEKLLGYVHLSFRADSAIRELANQDYDLMFLDHDLSDIAFTKEQAEDAKTNNGMEVCKYLADQMKKGRFLNTGIIIHSTVADKGQEMGRLLTEAGNQHVVVIRRCFELNKDALENVVLRQTAHLFPDEVAPEPVDLVKKEQDLLDLLRSCEEFISQSNDCGPSGLGLQVMVQDMIKEITTTESKGAPTLPDHKDARVGVITEADWVDKTLSASFSFKGTVTMGNTLRQFLDNGGSLLPYTKER
jgi:hypothetical protein